MNFRFIAVELRFFSLILIPTEITARRRQTECKIL
jgi:hypothetical protein